MENRVIPLCYHPTRVVLVEDDQHYINDLLLELNPENASYQAFAEPEKALAFLKDIYRLNPVVNRYMKEDALHDRHIVEVNVRSIFNEIYNTKRFSEIAVLVIDCAMPGMNGLEVCEQLKDKPFKRILLTSEAQPQIPIQGFNEGQIHHYVRKDSEDFNNTINTAIERAQWQYFLEQSAIVRNNLSSNSQLRILSDLGFIQLFNKLREQTQNSEFYLLDKHGSFLLLDNVGEPSWLLVKSEQELQNLAEYADEEGADEETINALTSRTMLPFFHSDEDMQTPPNQWQGYLHPATLLKGEHQRYYYAFTSDSKHFELKQHEILSYRAYLQTLNSAA